MKKPKLKLYTIIFIIFLISFLSSFSRYNPKIISFIATVFITAFIILCIVLTVRYNRYIEQCEIKQNQLIDVELKERLKKDDLNKFR